MAWRVYFDDGTAFDSTQGTVLDIPNKGIVAVASTTPSPNGTVYKDFDWYLYTPSLGFRAVTLQQLLYQIVNNPDSQAVVRQGALVDDATYNSIVAAANAFA